MHAYSTETLLSHMETGVEFPTDAQFLYPVVLELHDLGLSVQISGSPHFRGSRVVSDLLNQVAFSVHADFWLRHGMSMI